MHRSWWRFAAVAGPGGHAPSKEFPKHSCNPAPLFANREVECLLNAHPRPVVSLSHGRPGPHYHHHPGTAAASRHEDPTSSGHRNASPAAAACPARRVAGRRFAPPRTGSPGRRAAAARPARAWDHLHGGRSVAGLAAGIRRGRGRGRHHAYLADHDGGVSVLDITDPARPVRAAWHPAGSGILKMTYAEGRLYVITAQHDWPFFIGSPRERTARAGRAGSGPARPPGRERVWTALRSQRPGGGRRASPAGGRGAGPADRAARHRAAALRSVPVFWDACTTAPVEPPVLAASGSDPAAFTIEHAAALNQPVQWEETEATISAADPASSGPRYRGSAKGWKFTG